MSNIRNSTVLTNYLDDFKKELYTSIPAKIVAYNPETQQCSAQPLLYVDDLEMPTITGIPVIFPSGGGGVLTFPVKTGDKCWLSFSMLPLEQLATGDSNQAVSVNGKRSHDISDCVAFVGFSSAKQNFKPDPDNVQLKFGSLSFTFQEDGKAILEGSLHVTKEITTDKTVYAKEGIYGENFYNHDGLDFNSHQHHYYWTSSSGEDETQPPA